MGQLDGWRFCPRCAAELAGDRDRVECAACGFIAYANSAPAACAVVEDDEGRILLGRRAWEPYQGMWDLPGGFLGETEDPLDALRRELREETSLEIEPIEWLGTYLVPYDGRTVLNLVWRAWVVSGEPHSADDVSELRWFARDELPPLDEIAMGEAVAAWLERPR